LWKLAFERTLLECSTAVHVSFEAEVAHLRTFGYRGPAIVVPHGIDVPAEAQWDGGSGGYLLWLGRFDIQHKGLDLLIQALAMMPAAGRPEVRLHGTGSARQMHEVKRLVAGHDMERWVQLCPPVYGKDKWAALRTARAFVYPSRWDSHSVAMMEAVAVGVPLITTRSTFIGQELADKSAALVVEPTPEALAAAMRTGLEPDAALFGERGHRLLESSYTWSVVARRFVDESIPLLRNGP
jgi:glycosyltransferase involved in cell wall biosynthesis